ncbi:hypothetical protein QBC45DRAFT_149155 [Copromyces sp. CBS 386.78]|nr:hypothetical protein QBC45DRAFT_149155 [Copromyces sp. CBS 386.78]
MSETTTQAPWPIGQSYLERLPEEIMAMILKAFDPKPPKKYLKKTQTTISHDPTRPAEVDYLTGPVDTLPYLHSRRTLRSLSLVSKQIISPIARMKLLEMISITSARGLLRLAKCLALYPQLRPHVKWLGIDSRFLTSCALPEEGFNACRCDGDECGDRPQYHRLWATETLELERAVTDNFIPILKSPDMQSFPDLGHMVHLVRLMRYTDRNLSYIMDDRVFEQVCNISLNTAIFFSPNLRTLRLTASGIDSTSFVFRYAMGIVPATSQNLGPHTIQYNQDVAKFLTVLDMDTSSMRHYSHDPVAHNLPCCPETLEELTLVDDGPIQVSGIQRCRGVEPHHLYIWLQPTKRLRKLRLFSGLDVDGLTEALFLGGGFGLSSQSHNINTILLAHRETLQHFEWCQMMIPYRTDGAAWIKMFGQTQRLSCLSQLSELRYLKLSDMFVYTRQQYLNRYPHAMSLGVYPPVRDLHTYRAVVTHNLGQMGTPPRLRSVYVGGHSPTDRYMRIDV